jgi:HEAT repeat protein
VAEALGYAADPAAVPSLLELLRDGKASVRATAAWALGRIADPRSVAPLLAALDDGVPEVRAEAVAALGRHGDARAVEPLVRSGRGESAWPDAVDALCAIGAPAVGPLIVALEDPAPGIRTGAAQGLGRIGDARAIGPLSVALRDPEASVRGAAADALGWIGDPRAVPALIQALSDEDHGGEAPVRMLRALQAIGRPAAEALKTARETADSQVQRRIDFALRGIPHV